MFEDIAQKGVVGTRALFELLEKPDVKIIDASYALPNSGVDTALAFSQKRIKGAQFFDITRICDQYSPLPHMLPTGEGFAHAMSDLGLKQSDFIVVYGQEDMSMGPARAWWMLRIFGHDRVAVLDGGLKAWERAGYSLETSLPYAPTNTNYPVPKIRSSLVLDMAEMQKRALAKECSILDARPKARFDGAQMEPRPGLRSGHIPGSANIPAGSMSDPETGCLKSQDELKKILTPYLKGKKCAPALTCGSGVTACMLSLGLYYIGVKDAAVYDGSWSEWGLETSPTQVVRSVE